METEAQRAARYAAKDLVDKLGVKPGDAVLFAGTKKDAALVRRIRLMAGRPVARSAERADVIVFWPAKAAEVTPALRRLRARLVPSGGLWVITAKRDKERAGRPYLGSEIIGLGLAAGLVDNKICSVSDTDTAMRFVIRRADRR
jgi:ABC-type sugar transport system substrate-binding protein